MKKFLLLIALCAAPANAADNATSYYVPPAQFNTAMEVMDMGFANIFALFRIATGSFTFDESAKSIGDLRIAIDTTSLTAGSPENQRALSDWLGAFQSSEIRIMAPDSAKFVDDKAQIKATVTLHGVAKPVSFDAVLNRSGKSPHGGGVWASEGNVVGISLRGALKSADFGLAATDPAAPARFGETITLRLEMQAIRQ